LRLGMIVPYNQHLVRERTVAGHVALRGWLATRLDDRLGLSPRGCRFSRCAGAGEQVLYRLRQPDDALPEEYGIGGWTWTGIMHADPIFYCSTQ